MPAEEKIRELHLRHEVEKKGYWLRKSETDPQKPHLDDEGGYMIVNRDNKIIAGHWFDLTLDDVEKFLKS
jgi:hypothetical protein